MNGTNATLAAFEATLAAKNGKRRVRTLSLAECLDCAKRVNDDPSIDQIAINGGGVAGAYPNHAITTIAFAARVDGSVYLGVGTANAKSSLGPGAEWNCLCSLASCKPARREEKLREWIACEGVVPASELLG